MVHVFDYLRRLSYRFGRALGKTGNPTGLGSRSVIRGARPMVSVLGGLDILGFSEFSYPWTTGLQPL